jgi:hypothetical protein
MNHETGSKFLFDHSTGANIKEDSIHFYGHDSRFQGPPMDFLFPKSHNGIDENSLNHKFFANTRSNLLQGTDFRNIVGLDDQKSQNKEVSQDIITPNIQIMGAEPSKTNPKKNEKVEN